MDAIKPAVRGCFERFAQPGIYELLVTAAPDGTLQHASVRGPAMETGTCLREIALTRLHMPPSSGAPYSLIYPFVLR